MNSKIGKIGINDSIEDVLFKLSEGNPGALTVCIGILKHGADIDPNNFAGGLGILLNLDSFGIYGPKIWMLHKDVCDKNLVHTIAVLRAVQLGLLNEETLVHAIYSNGAGINLPTVVESVKARLPEFNLNFETP